MKAQQKQHEEQMAALLSLLKKQTEKGTVSKPIARALPAFTPFDSSMELWRDYWLRFGTFVEAHSVPENKAAHVLLTNQTPVIYKTLTNLASQKTPPTASMSYL